MYPKIIIEVDEHSEGGLNYEIYDGGAEVSGDSVDGGICTSGCHKPDCKDDECEGCNLEAPYTLEDYRNALEMAVEQALEIVKKQLPK